jgi:PPP family 3-phenylpropionic acid transporter
MAIFSTGARISTLFVTSLTTYGVQVPFFPVLLADRGLGEKEIAVVVAAPMLLRVTTVSALGAHADRVGDRRRVLVAYTGLALLGCLCLAPAHGFPVLLTATIAMALFANACLPVIDAAATSATRRGEAVYGRMRAWGSAAYILANLGAGWAIGLWGAGVEIGRAHV